MKNKGSAKPSSSNGKPLVSKQAFQVAKTISGSVPNTADPNHAAEARGGSDYSQSQVHFGSSTRLPPVTSSLPGTAMSGFSNSGENHMSQYETDRQREKQLEAEIMGETVKASNNNNQQKSQAIEKNLNQMIKVLNSRLSALDQAAKTRLYLLEEDLKPLSNKMSDQAPKIVDEFDDSIPRLLRDTKNPSGLTGGMTALNAYGTANTGALGHLKDNLVSSDQVYIDPVHLVVRTKQPTEAGKKLEVSIEESFGTSNLREMKNKKNKNLNQSEKSKRTEQLKNEAKRMNRLRIEKKLQLNMENFVTRSVMDNEFVFQVPETNQQEMVWPVSVKWSIRDPASAKLENADGEFDPDLLLRYALERINLPSGRKLFSWLIKQIIIQHYFVALFWIIKVKFFDNNDNLNMGGLPHPTTAATATTTAGGTSGANNNTAPNWNLNMFSGPIEDREIFLLKLLAQEYRSIVELLANRSHAEHEKDFVYKFLPFILTNGVYYSFYYIFPGSRHLYTKGFKKTIYMQIIKIMHGFQICPISVKVSWAKLFPEDVHDGDNDEMDENGGEVFPVKLAIKSSPLNKYRSSRANSPKNGNNSNKRGIYSPNSPSRTDLGLSTSDDMDQTSNTMGMTNENMSNNSSNNLPIQVRAGMLSMDPDAMNNGNNHNHDSNNNNTGGNSTFRSIDSQGTNNDDILEINNGNVMSNTSSQDLTRPSSTSKPSHGTGPSSRTSTAASQPLIRNRDILLQNPGLILPLSKTYLQPLLERPTNIRTLVKRQNQVQRLNAQEISPQMTLFLTSMSSSSIDKDGKDIEIDASHSKQTFRRTIPVQWCAAGGSDTHQKRVVATDLHADFSVKLKQSQHEYQYHSYHFHHEKIKAVHENQKTLERILTSGPTNISRLSLDLIRRQRALRSSNKEAKNGAATETPQTHIEDIDLAAITALANYDDEEIERFLAEL